MTVLLDEDVPRALGLRLHGPAVESVGSRGWLGVKNGRLLRQIEESGFDVFITADKNMSFQQPIETFSFAVLVLSTNHWPTLRKKTQAVREAIDTVAPGRTILGACGLFLPSKQRKYTDVTGPVKSKE